MSVVLFLIPIVVAFATWYYLSVVRKDQIIKNIPGPRTIPFLGNALDFPNSQAFLPSLMKFMKEYGSMYRVSLGPTRSLIIASDTALLEQILTSMKYLDKSPDYNALHDWLGTGLLTSTGRKWHKHRKIITPTFHFEILEQFVETFNSSCDILIKKLEKEVGKSSFDVYPYITLCALDSICETAMGTKVYAQDDPDSEYVRSVKDMSRILVDKAFSPLKQFDWFFPLSRDYYKMKKHIKVLHGFSNGVIKRRRETLINSSTVQNGNAEKDEFGKKKKMAFLDLLLHATIDGASLSDTDIREEVDTFMFEGHDTTASAMTFALFELAQNKHIQDQVFDELYSIFGDDVNKPASHRDLQDMQYLELVIKETLRLYPSVPFFARELQEDVNFNGQLLPKGLTITIFAFGIQRDPKIFPNPDVFDPDRFLSENQSQRHYYSYVPFSAGPRNCIGQKFAMLEMKATISKVLRHYELMPTQPKHELKLAAETILKSANGAEIQIKKREYPKA